MARLTTRGVAHSRTPLTNAPASAAAVSGRPVRIYFSVGPNTWFVNGEAVGTPILINPKPVAS